MTDIEYMKLNNLLGDFTIGNLLRSIKGLQQVARRPNTRSCF
jgi:hypothetical protein